MAAVGDTVLFTLDQGRGQGQLRPAIIVRLLPDDQADLIIFLDGENDAGFDATFPLNINVPDYLAARTAAQGDGAGQWHERKPTAPAHDEPPPAPPHPSGKHKSKDAYT